LATKNRSEARGAARHDVQSKLVVEVIQRKHRDGDADALRAGDFKEVRDMRAMPSARVTTVMPVV